MAKYRVYAVASASWTIGEYEASSKEEAEVMADEDKEAEWSKGLCHHCACEVEVGDVYKCEVDEID